MEPPDQSAVIKVGQRSDFVQDEQGQRDIYAGIIRSVFGFVSGRSIVTFLSAATSIFLYRLLGPEETGKLALLMSLAPAIAMFTQFGFAEVLAKFVPESPSLVAKRKLFADALLITVIMTVLMAGVVVTWDRLVRPLPPEVEQVLPGFILYIGLSALFLVTSGMLRGLGQFVRLPLLQGIWYIPSTLLAIALIAMFGMRTFRVSFYTYLGFLGLALAGSFLWLGREWIPQRLTVPTLTREQWTFLAQILTGAVVFMVASPLQPVVVRTLLSAEDLGFYSVATRIPRMTLQMLVTPLQIPFLYYFTHSDTSAKKMQIIAEATPVIGFAGGLGALLLVAFGPIVITVLFGRQFAPSVPALQAFAPAIFAMSLLVFIGPFFSSINRPFVATLLGLFGIPIIVILDLVLIPRLGILGASIAEVVANMLQSIAFSVGIWYVYKVKILSGVGKLLLLFFFSLLVLVKINLWLGLAAYVIGAWLLRIVDIVRVSRAICVALGS